MPSGVLLPRPLSYLTDIGSEISVKRHVMTPEQQQLVKNSWAQLESDSRKAANLFYGRLFEVYPEVRPLFRGDMEAQGRKLMDMINVAVNSLDNLEPLTGVIRYSGKRHADYGVRDKDYDKVADALLWTLEHGLGNDFTPPVKEAWVAVYDTLADLMKSGAKTPAG
jgi:hemoglobin-like flavoprotein